MKILHGDCHDHMQLMIDAGEQFDGCASDPPYHLHSIVARFGGENAAPAAFGADGALTRKSGGFMGQRWDGGDIAFQPRTWRLVFELLRPGSYLTAFAHTTRYHRLACAIEEAGFEIIDMMGWAYGSGMPHSHNASKVFDRRAGKSEERNRTGEPQTDEAKATAGMGTRLKPWLEPICLARKPHPGVAIADNWFEHGTGLLNIDESRVEGAMTGVWGSSNRSVDPERMFNASPGGEEYRSAAHPAGRWPAGLIHDNSPEVVSCFPREGGAASPVKGSEPSAVTKGDIFGKYAARLPGAFHADSGSPARFFYSAKAAPIDRVARCKHCGTRAMSQLPRCCDNSEDASHPTVKPVDLMRWILTLTIPARGRVLDPFAGTGTTGIAALGLGMPSVLIEQDEVHCADAAFRLARVSGADTELFSYGR